MPLYINGNVATKRTEIRMEKVNTYIVEVGFLGLAYPADLDKNEFNDDEKIYLIGAMASMVEDDEINNKLSEHKKMKILASLHACRDMYAALLDKYTPPEFRKKDTKKPTV